MWVLRRQVSALLPGWQVVGRTNFLPWTLLAEMCPFVFVSLCAVDIATDNLNRATFGIHMVPLTVTSTLWRAWMDLDVHLLAFELAQTLLLSSYGSVFATKA